MAKTPSDPEDGRFEKRLERPKTVRKAPPPKSPAPTKPVADTDGADDPIDPNLTLQQQMFAEFYLGESNFNATDAARRAGYKHPTEAGYRLSRNVHILSRVRERMANAQMDADEVMQRLTNIGRLDVEHCLEYVTNKKGEVVEVKANRAEILKALEIIAKRHGLLRDKISLAFEGMTPAELRAFVAERVAARAAGATSILDVLEDAA